MPLLLKGAPVASALDAQTRQVSEMLISCGIRPQLAVVRLGERDDDRSYERSVLKRADRCGVAVTSHVLPEDTREEDLLFLISSLHNDSAIHGVLLFRPLPKHIDDGRVRAALSPDQDVDGITDASLAGVFTGSSHGFAPCTAEAVMEILDFYEIPVSGKHVAVLGRSLTVGRPLSMLMLSRNATVTLCHSKTENLPSVTANADLVVAAVGRPELLTADFFSAGQTVVDVGIHARSDGTLVGDVCFAEAEPIVSAITPVPGGVGAVTTSLLFRHVANAALRQSASE